VTSCEFIAGQIGTGGGTSQLLHFSPANHYSTMFLHTEMCNGPEQAAHYDTLVASFLIRHSG
jgi:hypothetical protein